MRKRMLIIAILAAAFLLPGMAFSKMDRTMPRDGWWRRPHIAELIKLTDDEKKQLEAKFVESQRKRLNMKAAVEKEKFELDVLLDKNAPEKDVMSQYAKMADARAKLGEEMFRFILDTRTIIGAERFTQIKNIAKEWRQKAAKRQPGDQWGRDRDPRLSRPTPEDDPETPEVPPAD